MITPKIQKSKAEQENIYMATMFPLISSFSTNRETPRHKG